MCDSRRPSEGADSAQDFLVDLHSIYDSDDRLTVRVTADGEREARVIAKRLHPDYGASGVRAA